MNKKVELQKEKKKEKRKKTKAKSIEITVLFFQSSFLRFQVKLVSTIFNYDGMWGPKSAFLKHGVTDCPVPIW